jgi:hypothetical protein
MSFLSGRTSLTTVQTGDIAADAITTAKIAAGAVETSDIATNAIDSTLTKDALIGDYTEVTIATGDSLLLGDVNDSGNTKRDTVQGLLDLAGGGAWNLIGTATASASASITVTGLSTDYETYAFEIVDIVPATDGSIHGEIRLGDSSGIDSGSSDYTWGVCGTNCNATMTNNVSIADSTTDDNADSMQITVQPGGELLGGNTGEGFSASGKLYSGGQVVPLIVGTIARTDQYNTGPSGGLEIMWGTFGGTRTTQIAVTQIQLLMGSGNITSGSMSVYGISKT